MKITKRQLKRIIKEELEAPQAKEVDQNSFDIEGIDHSDYPDYVDAFLSYGQYADGTEMTDEELQAWQDDNPSLFYDILQDFIH
jgi:gamma-glutamylcysteine synthetase